VCCSSSTATDSFHGSSVTFIQHPDVREPLPSLQLADVSWSRKRTCELPESYTSVPATGDVMCEVPIKSVNSSLTFSDTDQFQLLCPWLTTVESTVCQKIEHDNISFAAYHSASSVQVPTIKCNNTLLPLLPDHIQSPSTICHLMNVIIHITGSGNNGQPAVITGDQPVNAIAKYVQWKYPDLYGEDRIVMMIGGLHIEMAIQDMIGK